MKDEIISLIAETLEISKDRINENTNLIVDLGLESLDLVDLVAAFEKKYKVEILDKDIKNLQTVKDIIEYIEEKHV